jgi:uncharacterized membrane protein
MKTSNPFEFITEYLKRENIKIDVEEYKLQTETHPDYPSLLSFSDSLNFFNIDNLATRIPKDQHHNLPDRFIALFEPQEKPPFLTLVERKDNGFEYLSEGAMKFLNIEPFLSIWSGIVLIAEQTEETVKATSKNEIFGKIAIPLLFAVTALLIFYSEIVPFTFTGLAVLSILGIFLALEALKQEFGIKNTISAGVCNATPTTDCHAVINSEKTKILGKLSLSDISIIYFSSQFLSLLILGPGKHASSFLQITVLSLLLAIPVTLFSFYYQYAIAKKWCPVCLGIAGTLYLQFFILLFSFDSLISSFNWVGITSAILIYLFFTAIWLQTKPILKEYFALKSSNLENLRFRRNYSLFKNALSTTLVVEPAIMTSNISLGKTDAPLQISMVTNPFCKFCEGAHEALNAILKRNDLEVGINLRFNINPEKTEEKSILLHQGLLQIYENEGANAFMAAMDYWFSIKNVDQWLSKYGSSGALKPDILQSFRNEYNENAKNELVFTPAILINRRLYPKMYRPAELLGFISELAEDEEIIIPSKEMEIIK